MSPEFQQGRSACRAGAPWRRDRARWGLAAGSRAVPAALRLLRLLVCQLLPAGWLLLSAASASAAISRAALPQAPASEPAPMCDLDGASVAAQDEIPEVDRGHFEALPCEAQLLLAGWELDAPELGRKAARCHDAEPQAPAQHAAAPHPRPEGASQVGSTFPARSEPTLVALGAHAGLSARRGHASTPFRPPLARALARPSARG